MPRKIEKNAKSKEEALKLAAKEFGVSVDELSYTVEREIGKGLLGKLLGKEVIISAWITKEAEEEEQLRAAREERRKMVKEMAYANKDKNKAKSQPSEKSEEAQDNENAKEKSVEKKTDDFDAIKKEQAKPAAKAPEKPAETSTEKSVPEAKAEKQKTIEKKADDGKKREVTEKSVADAQYFAENLIHLIGLSDAKVVATNGGQAVDIDVSGEKMGLIIGKRGDTLDAIQYLTSLYVNKEKNSYIKINIDTEGYRAKREKTLINLAGSLERRVLRIGDKVELEPMNPNERRIIHSALQDSKSVTTYSVGEEPRRRVVVAPKD